jgi:ComF family protein
MAHAVALTVYPKVCAGCGMRGDWLCEFCDGTVPAVDIPLACQRCGVPRLQNRCGCVDLDPLITRARSAFAYDGWVAESVKLLKYHGEPARAEHLATFMQPLLGAFGPLDALVPVPLHPSRERQRGYNQSALLARELSRHTGIPVVPLLRRTVATVSQTTLSGEERKRNVHGAFAVDPAWQPRPGGRYLLIDDVRTTGSTLSACADPLRAFRPAAVGVATFALDLHRDRIEALRRLQATGAGYGSP